MGKTLIYILSEVKGGVEEYIMNLSRFDHDSPSKYGYLVMGERTVYEEELKNLGVDYYYVPDKANVTSNIRIYSELLKKLRKEYDTIYFNTSGLYYSIPYLYAKKYNYKIVLHSHSSTGAPLKKPIHYFNRKWINKVCSERLACSTPAGEWMFGGKEEFILIPNAIELDRFMFSESSRKDCRDRYHLGNSFVIGSIGRLHQVKNQIFLVDILKALVDAKVDAMLLLVGDGDMRQAIEDKAIKLEVRNKVVFAGQSDIPEYYYSAMDCFVMPSFAEGFPISLVEAQANGLPCIVSDRVTQETNVSGLIKYMSIDDTPQSWAKELLLKKERYNCMSELKEKGYDVRSLNALVWRYLATKKYDDR